MSRSPVGLNPDQLRQIKKPKDILVAKTDLNLDPQIKQLLRNLATLQNQDARIEELKQKLATAPTTTTEKYNLENECCIVKTTDHSPFGDHTMLRVWTIK
jgi:hypothetical protein